MNDVTEELVELNSSQQNFEKRILEETDPKELKNVIDLFNLNIKKKDIIRTGKLNDLQDKITDQIALRIENNANQFSNKDLLDYFKIMQDTINKADTSTDNITSPQIQLNELNINVEQPLDIDSRKRVLNAVSAILSSQNNIIDIDDNSVDIMEGTENPNE